MIDRRKRIHSGVTETPPVHAVDKATLYFDLHKTASPSARSILLIKARSTIQTLLKTLRPRRVTNGPL